MAKLSEILFGKPERLEQVSSLNPMQQEAFKQYMQAIQGQGAGGAYGDIADYYRSFMGNDPSAFAAFEAPIRREFEEDILPGLSEQFAGLGAGGTSSSAFRNSAQRAGTELSERLATLRSGLRQQAAQGLQGLASGAFNPVQENVFRPQTYGLAGELASAAGSGLGSGLGMAAGQYFNPFQSRKQAPRV